MRGKQGNSYDHDVKSRSKIVSPKLSLIFDSTGVGLSPPGISFFLISKFSYKLIRFLLDSSVVKSVYEINNSY